MLNKQLLSTKDIENIFGITKHTVMQWRNNGILPYTKINERKFLYKKDDIEKLINTTDSQDTKKQNIIYCRVSNLNQKEDLRKQKQLLINYCNINGVIPDLILTEISSGIEEDRVEFNKLLDLVINNQIDKVFISDKDRFIRFGFNHFKNLFSKYNTEIIVLNNPINENNSKQELIEDIISIIKEFNTKIYDNKKIQLEKIQKILKL